MSEPIRIGPFRYDYEKSLKAAHDALDTFIREDSTESGEALNKACDEARRDKLYLEEMEHVLSHCVTTNGRMED